MKTDESDAGLRIRLAAINKLIQEQEVYLTKLKIRRNRLAKALREVEE